MEVLQVYKYILFSTATRTTAPEIHLHFLTNDTCRVKVNWFSSVVQLGGGVKWPGKASVDKEGFIRLHLDKMKEGNWSVPFKQLLGNKNYSTEIPRTWKTTVIRRQQLNYDSCLLTIQHNEPVYNHIGTGRHITIHQKVKGLMRRYQYTPVPFLPLKSLNDPNPVPGNWFSTKNNIYLFVKSYPNGTLSKWLCEQDVGDEITVSNPQGTFDVSLLRNATEVYFFAGGTGLAPVLSLSVWLLQTTRDVSIKLFFFNREERDIVWKKEMNKMANDFKNFKVEYILSRPKSEKWSGRKGRINLDMLKDIVEPFHPNKPECNNRFFGICGQVTFTITLWRNLTTELGYPANKVYRFLGQ
ncbi:cytochrome b5 reductase 4-like isoform X2 [Lycorma delicatula]